MTVGNPLDSLHANDEGYYILLLVDRMTVLSLMLNPHIPKILLKIQKD